jgi:hypothetical protein
VRTDAEIKQTVIAILTSVRDGQAGSDAELFTGPGAGAGQGSGREALSAAIYAMTLFHLLAAEFEAACPDVDVRAFLQRRALEAAADGEAA